MEEPGAGGSLSRWSELPADCLERIFALAGARPTAVAASVCRQWRAAFQSSQACEHLWKGFCQQEFPDFYERRQDNPSWLPNWHASFEAAINWPHDRFKQREHHCSLGSAPANFLPSMCELCALCFCGDRVVSLLSQVVDNASKALWFHVWDLKADTCALTLCDTYELQRKPPTDLLWIQRLGLLAVCHSSHDDGQVHDYAVWTLSSASLEHWIDIQISDVRSYSQQSRTDLWCRSTEPLYFKSCESRVSAVRDAILATPSIYPASWNANRASGCDRNAAALLSHGMCEVYESATWEPERQELTVHHLENDRESPPTKLPTLPQWLPQDWLQFALLPSAVASSAIRNTGIQVQLFARPKLKLVKHLTLALRSSSAGCRKSTPSKGEFTTSGDHLAYHNPNFGSVLNWVLINARTCTVLWVTCTDDGTFDTSRLCPAEQSCQKGNYKAALHAGRVCIQEARWHPSLGMTILDFSSN